MKIELGPFTAGEVPAPLAYTFRDANGDLIDLTGFSGEFHLKRGDNVAVIVPAVVAGSAATHTWQAAHLATPGIYQGIFWVGNGTNRYASIHFQFRVLAAPAEAPAI